MNRNMLKSVVLEGTLSILLPSTPRAARNGRATLVSVTRPWPEVSLLAFLRQCPDVPRVYWESGEGCPEPLRRSAEEGCVGFAGCGVVAMLTADGPDRFEIIRQQADQLFDHALVETSGAPPVVGPRLFGGFAFQPDQEGQGTWDAFPAAYFVLPRYQLTRAGRWTWLTLNRLLEPGEDAEQVVWQLDDEMQKLEPPGAMNHQGPTTNTGHSSLVWRSPLIPDFSAPQLDIDYVMEPTAWRDVVTASTHRIRRGELDKVVLAQGCRVRSSRPIDPADVLGHLGQDYPDCYRFLIEPIPGHAFYGATPELLVEVNDSIVRTVALAGSIRRGSSPEEDAALGEALLASPKDRHEHALVVEAVQENLLPLVTKLYVPGKPGLCRLSNIQHLQTAIRGELAQVCGVLPVVEALHPTPAVGGSPRDVALRLIDEAEPFPRGWYASPVGWIDPQGNGLFAVALRSAVSVGNETWLYAGAGIVADSDPQREWEEIGLKFRPVLEAISASVLIGD